MRPLQILSLLCIAATAGLVTAAHAADPCSGFQWDVSQEHALFAGPGITAAAGKDVAGAPRIGTNRLYRLQLLPQNDVAFAVPPARTMQPDGAYAGLAALTLDAPGGYRVAVDVPLWIDVVADGRLAQVNGYQGQHDCTAPRKIVEFDLTGAGRFVLQISGSAAASIRLTVTPAPAAAPRN